MRVVALHLLLLLLLEIYLHVGGAVQAENNNNNPIIYYNNAAHPNITAYVELLQTLRAQLTSGSHAHDISILRRPADVVTKDRFLQIQLENGAGNIITVIIDVVNVYVVGYLRGNNILPTFHHFTDTPPEAFDAFPASQYKRSPLGFSSAYGDLGNRENEELGHGALNQAIDALFYRYSQRSAFLVIIQMLAEASRIRYIEHLVRRSMISNSNFLPDSRALSLQNRWSDLSEQIQWSGDPGVFLRTIEIRSVSNQVVAISNVIRVFRDAAVALLLYRCRPGSGTNNNNVIRMPIDIAAANQCPLVEPTTNIIGRDGLCVDVRDGRDNDGNPIQLWPCGNVQRNQLWTFKSDGTIRSMGKCLTTYGYSPGNYIMIFNCSTAVTEATQWQLIDSGTIMNPQSGLVLAAESATQGTTLTVAEDNNSSRQAWNAGNYSQPVISYISGFREMCLQSNGANARVWLADCVIGNEPRQQWAFYGDNTIRLYSDRSLCVTSDGHNSMDRLILLRCQGWGNQRWTFMADGTILNPNARLVMDVRSSDVSLQQIILYQPTGNNNQQWLAF